MPLISNQSAQQFEIPGVAFTALASPSRGSSETAMWKATVAPRNVGALHHMTREEIILAVSGLGVVRIGGVAHDLQPGDVFAVPPFTDFQLESANDQPFEAIVALPVGGRAVLEGQPAFPPPWSL